MPKQPLLSQRKTNLPSIQEEGVEDTRRLLPRALFARIALGLLTLFVAYELAQFVIGACQGYSGVAAYERSLLGLHLGIWSIDPLTCR